MRGFRGHRRYHRAGMQWPEGARDHSVGTPQLSIGPTGRVEPTVDAAAAADDRFEAICAELGILLARRVEPVSARVLPFGREQLAMVQVLDGTQDAPTFLTAAARGSSRGVAVAEAAIDAMTGGNNVLAAALPGAVAEGKVRTAVVFAESDAPVRWGLANDEGRLAALYAVVPHLGSFTATAGADTYRVLRLPGVGVSLVSEGPSAAAWVEGWFAALIHATQFALRTAQPTTSVVSPTRSPLAADRAEDANQVLSELEGECRRILTAAQEQAAEILESARSEAAREDDERRAESVRLESLRAELRAVARDDVRRAPHDDDVRRPRVDDLERAREGHERAEIHRLVAERERLALLADAERERASLLAEARREADGIRRDAERDRATLLADAKREVDELLRDAERSRSSMLETTRRELDEVRHDAEKARRKAESREGSHGPPRGEGRWMRDVVMSEARRAADDVLREARRAAEEILRDAAEVRQRLSDEVRTLRATSPVDAEVASPTVTPREADPDLPVPTAPPDTRAAELALVTAAAESVSAMAALLGRVATSRGDATGDQTAEPLSDVPHLFFGA
jgi:regulator of protease activity HflC (stomatin/prohibitin superfamily)